jgi:hypothetical protein
MTGPRYSIIPYQFLDDGRLKMSHVKVMATLCRHVNRSGWCRIRQAVLGDEAGVGRQAVNRALADLVKWGHVEIHEKAKGQSKAYRVLMESREPPPDDLPEDEINPDGLSPVGDKGCRPQTTGVVASDATGVVASDATTKNVFLTREKKDPLTPKGAVTPNDALRAFEAYNAAALRLAIPQASRLTPDRQRRIMARLRDYGPEGWQRALDNLAKSAFLLGQTDKGFRADLDFVVQAKSFGRLHDGGYGSDAKAKTPGPAKVRMRPMTPDEIELYHNAGIF